MSKPEMPEELAALLETGRDVRIPLSAPVPVTEEDAERLYALNDECAVAKDHEGWYVTVDESVPAIRRVFNAMRDAGFRSPILDALDVPETATPATVDS